MHILSDLIQYAHAHAVDGPVHEVCLGLHWTGVYGPRLGLSATRSYASCCASQDVRAGGRLHELSAFALLDYLVSSHPLEADIGMAALNAILPVDPAGGIECNARDLLLERARGRQAALVGHFPFTDALRQAASRLWVLELEPGPGDLPACRAPEVLPQAEVIGLTATTLLNGTFEGLAELFPPQALVVMLGPTTPLCPALFDHGVDVLAGAYVTDPQSILHSIMQASPLHRPPGLQRLTLARHAALL